MGVGVGEKRRPAGRITPHSASPTHLLPRAGQGRHVDLWAQGEGRQGGLDPGPRGRSPGMRSLGGATGHATWSGLPGRGSPIFPAPRAAHRRGPSPGSTDPTHCKFPTGNNTLPGLHHLRTFSPNPHPSPPRRRLLTFPFLHTALTDLFSQASPTQNPPTTSLKTI